MAVRALLQLARDVGRWRLVRAFPATTNGICRLSASGSLAGASGPATGSSILAPA